MSKLCLKGFFGLSFLMTLFMITGCKKSKPEFVFMPDMSYSASIKAQEPGSMRHPVPGTVARGVQSYRKAGNKNPLLRTKVVLARGQMLFNTYCAVCHGPQGAGDGSIVPPYPRPPSLLSEKIRNYQDSDIYHIITMGQNLMPSYAAQVQSEDRWAIAHYIRVLHRAQSPSPEDLEEAKKSLQE